MKKKRFSTYIWKTLGGYCFKLVLSKSTYSIAVFKDGKRVEWTGRKWGPSITDALAMASHKADPNCAHTAMVYLFRTYDMTTEQYENTIPDAWSRAALTSPA